MISSDNPSRVPRRKSQAIPRWKRNSSPSTFHYRSSSLLAQILWQRLSCQIGWCRWKFLVLGFAPSALRQDFIQKPNLTFNMRLNLQVPIILSFPPKTRLMIQAAMPIQPNLLHCSLNCSSYWPLSLRHELTTEAVDMSSQAETNGDAKTWW